MHQLVVMIEDLEKINQHLAQTKDSLLHKMNEIHLKMPELVSEHTYIKEFSSSRSSTYYSLAYGINVWSI
jgi:uncharacterized membrane-anchored protein YhcB (DUF1043 family)